MTYDLTCEVCGFQMNENKCKIRCPNCGFTRDCSDPWRPLDQPLNKYAV